MDPGPDVIQVVLTPRHFLNPPSSMQNLQQTNVQTSSNHKTTSHQQPIINQFNHIFYSWLPKSRCISKDFRFA